MEESPSAAAEIARTMSECMNLLFLFGAPRVLASIQRENALDESQTLTSLRRFLGQVSGIRSRRNAPAEELDRLVRSAMLVEEIAGVLSARGAALAGPLPAAVVQRARDALAIFGIPAPEGGWDAFEGYTLPTPGKV